MGSLAFVAAARAVWGVVKDKGDPDRRLVLPIKNNIGNDASGLAYKVIRADNGAPCLEWEPDPVNVDVSEAMAPAISNGGGESKVKGGGAKDWLLEVLADGPMPVKEIKRLASDAGLSWRTGPSVIPPRRTESHGAMR